jgi:septal ring factor EnvC (AmiA/AmiB activator)
MTAKRKFPEITAEADAPISKAAEVAWLTEAAASLPEGSYLKSLFSNRLIEWFRIQTASDLDTDLVAALCVASRADAQAAQTELRRVVAQIEAEQREVIALQKKLGERDFRIAELTEARSEAYADIERRAAEYHDLSTDYNTLSDKLVDALIKVRDLKARLWDAGISK